MKLYVEFQTSLNLVEVFLCDRDSVSRIARVFGTFLTESDAKDFCRKYFPQFKLEGEQELPESFCVLNDGSSGFEDFRRWSNRNGTCWDGYSRNAYFGKLNGEWEASWEPFAPVLTLEQFTQLTK